MGEIGLEYGKRSSQVVGEGRAGVLTQSEELTIWRKASICFEVNAGERGGRLGGIL